MAGDRLDNGRVLQLLQQRDLPDRGARHPLILGLDVTQASVVGPVIDIITNHEAIAVNQEWAGHPGALVWSAHGGAMGYPAARKCDLGNKALKQSGWSLSKPSAAGTVAIQAPPAPILTLNTL